MVAYHFPPLTGSSGIQRTLRFVRYLPKFGWGPLVLTAQVRAYEPIGSAERDAIPAATVVRRAFALDAARHLALRGRYPRWLATPDRWVSWYLGGVVTGLAMVRRYRPEVIWSSFPIATAHMIAGTLARLTGLPWIADCRDPMVQADYPPDPAQKRALRRIEKMVYQRAGKIVFTTPGAARLFRERYAGAEADTEAEAARVCVIENGYDEETFAHAEGIGRAAPSAESERAGEAPGSERRFVLLHSGIVYPSERDPHALFGALSSLKTKGILTSENFCLRLRASAHDAWLAEQVAKHDIADVVAVEPPLPYHEALAEMLNSDGLLIMQAGNCNQQIPAKLYEYLRARKPILGLTDPCGDTAEALRAVGVGSIARLDAQNEIEDVLAEFIGRVRAGTEPLPPEEQVAACSRESRTASLARLLNHAASVAICCHLGMAAVVR